MSKFEEIIMQKINQLLFDVLDPPKLIGVEDNSKQIIAASVAAIFLAVVWAMCSNVYS